MRDAWGRASAHERGGRREGTMATVRSVAAADQLTLKVVGALWMCGRARARGSNPAPTHL